MTVPPTERTPLGELFQKHQQAGALRLQRCGGCGAFQYPTREVCRECLSDALMWETVAHGIVTSTSRLHTTNEAAFRPLVPFDIASIRVEGVQVVAFAADGATSIGAEVALTALTDDGGRFVVCAIPLDSKITSNTTLANMLKRDKP